MANPQLPGDEALHIRFYSKANENKRKSAEAGRPIFDDCEMVEIKFPGDQKRIHHAPAHETHYNSGAKQQMTYAERFPRHYQAFKEQASDGFVPGTPLSEVPFLTEARRSEYRAMNIKSVEQLAALDDRAIKKLGIGARDMVEQAQAYLAAASETAEVAALRAELAELKAGQHKAFESTVDPFEGMEDEDLKNMIRDAGGTVPTGRANRATLIAKLNELSEAAAA